METLGVDRNIGTKMQIDVCRACHAFWFDTHESLQLSPAATLQLFGLIGETSGPRTPLSVVLKCPRCSARLVSTNDQQRNTSFRYFRCARGHGRFTTFFDFLREKDFIRPLSAQQIEELRHSVQFVNCSNCGGPVDLVKGSSCPHCGTPLSMLDSKQAQTVVDQLKRAAEPRPIDPALPLELARVRREVEMSFDDAGSWKNAASSGIVEAGFGALMAWLKSR
jgi:DNA-directed RNA polymerase subunit RPC12/RpoP